MEVKARGRPLVIGHRGAAAQAPANSLEGLRAAVEAAADLVEFDVDAELCLGHPGEDAVGPAVSLGDALSALTPWAIGIQLDLKARGIETQIAEAVASRGLAERVIVSSAWARSVRRLRREAPWLTCAVSYPRDRLGAGDVAWPESVSRAVAWGLRLLMPWRMRLLLRESGAGIVSLQHRLVSPAVVAAARARGVGLIAWTVNDPVRVAELARLGVDAITSDDPQMALAVLGTLEVP